MSVDQSGHCNQILERYFRRTRITRIEIIANRDNHAIVDNDLTRIHFLAGAVDECGKSQQRRLGERDRQLAEKDHAE
jgi:hypothetical protein